MSLTVLDRPQAAPAECVGADVIVSFCTVPREGIDFLEAVGNTTVTMVVLLLERHTLEEARQTIVGPFLLEDPSVKIENAVFVSRVSGVALVDPLLEATV